MSDLDIMCVALFRAQTDAMWEPTMLPAEVLDCVLKHVWALRYAREGEGVNVFIPFAPP